MQLGSGDGAADGAVDAYGTRWGGTRWVQPTDPHALGVPSAAVGIVVWADFCCPYCAAAAPVLTSLVADGDDTFAVSFRHFPRADVHPTAVAAALLAEAAHDRDLFWPAHDMLFALSGDVTADALRLRGADLGLRGHPTRGRHGGAYGARVEQDRDAGVSAGVVATPGVYVNGDPYVGELTRTAVSAEAERRL